MNFNELERAVESNKLATHLRQQAIAVARAAAIEDRAEMLHAQLTMTPTGTCPKAMDEAIGDLCIRPEMLAALARYKDEGKPEAAGFALLEWFDVYWERRCRELAEDAIDAEEERAREYAIAEALL